MRRDVPRGPVVSSEIPARLDALGWSSWHRRVVAALGVTWILDGLEASLIANLAPTLQDERTLGLRAAQLGLVNSAYLLGQVAGALLFGHLTDCFGRKRLFLVTWGLYLGASAARPRPARTLAARPVRVAPVTSTQPCFGCLIPIVGRAKIEGVEDGKKVRIGVSAYRQRGDRCGQASAGTRLAQAESIFEFKARFQDKKGDATASRHSARRGRFGRGIWGRRKRGRPPDDTCRCRAAARGAEHWTVGATQSYRGFGSLSSTIVLLLSGERALAFSARRRAAPSPLEGRMTIAPRNQPPSQLRGLMRRALLCARYLSTLRQRVAPLRFSSILFTTTAAP